MEKIFHQPNSVKCSGAMIEVTSRPSVGTSHINPIAARRRCTGALPTMRRIFEATVSGGRTASAVAATVAISAPSGNGLVLAPEMH